MRIPPLRVLRIDDAAAVPGPVALSEDVEVMTVQMHGMRGEREVIVHDKPDRRVGAEIVHFFGLREGGKVTFPALAPRSAGVF